MVTSLRDKTRCEDYQFRQLFNVDEAWPIIKMDKKNKSFRERADDL